MKHINCRVVFGVFMLAFSTVVNAQDAVVRGVVLDGATGEPIPYATVILRGSDLGTVTDLDGFFNIPGIEAGSYTISVFYLGYDSISNNIQINAGEILNRKLLMSEMSVQLAEVEVSSQRAARTTEVGISRIGVTQTTIKALPSTGGEADIAQYLQVLPGVITTGDQGGQIYIRGGTPVQNKILLDGMTIYNPFHSIGQFSVFETEALQQVDVYTGGFGAEYGGRVSAVMDVKTRDGNRSRYGGLVSASPFQAKAMLEGPLMRFDPAKEVSASFLLTAKHSLLDNTSQSLYSYANDSLGLPFDYTDIYGKLSLLTGNGSKLEAFGFSFNDRVQYAGLADLEWNSGGGGFNFKVVPGNSNLLIGGTIAYSAYELSLQEGNDFPRSSGISGFTAGMDFTYFGPSGELNYGFEIIGFRTDLQFRNLAGITIEEVQNTTELGAFVTYRLRTGKLVLEPGVRGQFYSSLSDFSFEPRLAFKLNATDNFRIKMSSGFYSQNLISTVNDRDVVNLFVGFLSGPEDRLFKPSSTELTDHNLQKSIHGVAGFEFDPAPGWQINVEGYVKDFTQLIALNRNKLQQTDPNFITETGLAYGLDVSGSYTRGGLTAWLAYSLGQVKRDDGEEEFPAHYDRRHNLNVVTSYNFGPSNSWEVGARWNFGSGFPFTPTQGFYGQYLFRDGLATDPRIENPALGIIYSDDRNGARLPTYHRLDLSLKRQIRFGEHASLEITGSVTNVYDRANVFYFDRVEFERVDQLPILPSLGIMLKF